MNKNGCNCYFCCCECENLKNDWECGKENHKCCQCEKQNQFLKHGCQEKEFNKFECSCGNYLGNNYDCGIDHKSKYENYCGCQKGNSNCEKYNQKNFGWY